MVNPEIKVNLSQNTVMDIEACRLRFDEKLKKISEKYNYEPIRESLVVLTLTKDGAEGYGLQGAEEGHKYLYYLEGIAADPFGEGIALGGNFIDHYEKEPNLAFPKTCRNYIPFGGDKNIIAYSQPSEDEVKEFKTRLEACIDRKLATKLMNEFFQIRQKCKPFMEEIIQNINKNNIIKKELNI